MPVPRPASKVLQRAPSTNLRETVLQLSFTLAFFQPTTKSPAVRSTLLNFRVVGRRVKPYRSLKPHQSGQLSAQCLNPILRFYWNALLIAIRRMETT